MTLKVKKLRPDAILPVKAHPTDLGYDLFAASDITIWPGGVGLVSTGIACHFPRGYGALIRDRSGVATKMDLFVVAGVIDETYTGEIKVAMRSAFYAHMPPTTREIKAGMKIAQMIIIPTYTFPIEEVTELSETDRGDKGFGSSGQ